MVWLSGDLQFDPDEAIRLADMIADVVKCDRLGFGIVEEQAVDDVPPAAIGKCVNSSP